MGHVAFERHIHGTISQEISWPLLRKFVSLNVLSCELLQLVKLLLDYSVIDYSVAVTITYILNLNSSKYVV